MSRPRGIIIAIDGPAGVGKSTIGRLAASRLGYKFFSTGRMYRALALKALEAGLPVDDGPALAALARRLRWEFRDSAGPEHDMYVDGALMGDQLSEEKVSRASSAVAKLREVRDFMRDRQREAGRAGGVIMEGRDIGTNVFPDAELKIYLDASPEARASRRVGQLKQLGQPADYGEILDFIKKRDAQDSGREHSPLKKADDGHYLDSTELTREQVVEEIVRLHAAASGGGR
ncbi:MAG TPA: (d)CMP kinase [Elusimicrobiales bacterium]|nr:(d)CMP kinase [Elusimicrobiales bacterium]